MKRRAIELNVKDLPHASFCFKPSELLGIIIVTSRLIRFDLVASVTINGDTCAVTLFFTFSEIAPYCGAMRLD